MTIDVMDSRALTTAIEQTTVVEPFILGTFFKSPEDVGAETVDIVIEKRTSKIAKFVNEGEEPRLIGKTGRSVKTVKIPKTFEKKIFTPTELRKYRNLGETYMDDAQASASANRMVVKELEDLKQRALNLREYMACQAIAAGKIEVRQSNIEFDVDFDFVSTEQLITLSGANLWSASTAKIINRIRAWKSAMSKRGYGATDIILGEAAAEAFINDEAVLKFLNNNNTRVGAVDYTKQIAAGGNLIGNFAGLNIWEYTQTYTDDNGTAQLLIPTDRAIVLSKQNENRVYRAPIYRINDRGLDVTSTDMLVYSKVNDNNTLLTWEVEQKSLCAICDPGAVISAKVV
jgi:predicted RNA-binding protein YlqC (UPF0109 family)